MPPPERRAARSLARAALHLLQVLLDALIDQARDAKRLAAGAAIDQGLGPGEDAVEEGVDLVAETVLFLDLVSLRRDRRQSLDHRVAAQAVAVDAALAEIAAEIVVAGEDAHAPLGLVAHAARGHVGDAARFE